MKSTDVPETTVIVLGEVSVENAGSLSTIAGVERLTLSVQEPLVVTLSGPETLVVENVMPLLPVFAVPPRM